MPHRTAAQPRSPPTPSATDAVELLRTMPLFDGLPDGELDEIAARCDLATAHPGQVVQAQDVPVRRGT